MKELSIILNKGNFKEYNSETKEFFKHIDKYIFLNYPKLNEIDIILQEDDNGNFSRERVTSTHQFSDDFSKLYVRIDLFNSYNYPTFDEVLNRLIFEFNRYKC